ncbi:MAG: RecX family transcriptional regulator [Actinobacteria bacterium]|nr:RecX family transcriptional regulator [Actinomycetota bacterium]
MPVVTALRATRRGQVAVHVDGGFVCSVSDAFVARWHLYQGRELDDDALAELRARASAELVLADAYRLLGHRARGRHELRRRLLQKGHDEQVVAGALERLIDDGLLDDAEFARCYVADKRSLSGWGSQRIRRGLAELDVDHVVIDAALGAAAAAEGDEAELERALRALRRRAAPQPPLDAARRRAYQALLRRGFSSSVAYAAIRLWSGEQPPGDFGQG